MKTIKIILILCLSILFSTSCKKKVDMTLMQKTMFENITISQIEVNDAWSVTVVADSSVFVEVKYSAYLENYLKINMEGTKLHVGFTGWVHNEINSVFEAVVHTNQLEKLEIDDAAKVQCVGDFFGQKIEVEISGAANCNGLVFSGEGCEISGDNAAVLTGFQFIGNSCKAELDNASQFNGDIQASNYFELELKSASRFVNKGNMTAKAIIKMQDVSFLNMVDTQVREMQVELSSASEATVRVSELLEGFLHETSTLYYKGHPQIDIDCSGDSQLIPF